MRDIKTLLEVLLSQYLKHKDDTVRDEGLCYAIKVLTLHGVFTKKEKDMLDSFIYDHRPDKSAGEDDFWWVMGYMHPRVKFLEQLISEL